jgi:hypothetical protein
MMAVPPPPRFRRFERVRQLALPGEIGVIVWLDFSHHDKTGCGWICVVFLPAHDRYITLNESDLETTGEFDSECSYLGQVPEVSFDLVMEDDMSFVEGTFRLPGEFWRVFVFGKWDGAALQCKRQIWPNKNPWRESIDGLAFSAPKNANLNRAYVLAALSEALNIRDWTEVRGPDSISLR